MVPVLSNTMVSAMAMDSMQSSPFTNMPSFAATPMLFMYASETEITAAEGHAQIRTITALRSISSHSALNIGTTTASTSASANMDGVYTEINLRIKLSWLDLNCAAFSDIRTSRAAVDCSKLFVTRTLIGAVTFVHPEYTLYPTATSHGRACPDIAEVSTVVTPSTMIPSSGIRSPAGT